ncbi:hypothetical protein ISN45_Aa06g009390, partial [Arabidopsis thaliana x Arabidopsis arenosa]
LLQSKSKSPSGFSLRLCARTRSGFFSSISRLS